MWLRYNSRIVFVPGDGEGPPMCSRQNVADGRAGALDLKCRRRIVLYPTVPSGIKWECSEALQADAAAAPATVSGEAFANMPLEERSGKAVKDG